MSHQKLNIQLTRDWSRRQGEIEPETGVTSAGGLAHRMSHFAQMGHGSARQEAETTVSMSADPKRQSLGKFIELSRRKLRLSVEQLAERANVELAELLAIEKAEDVVPEPRTIYQLSKVLVVRAEPLLELAGLVNATSSALTQTAVRFAARSEPMDALSKDEEEALKWFINELAKP